MTSPSSTPMVAALHAQRRRVGDDDTYRRWCADVLVRLAARADRLQDPGLDNELAHAMLLSANAAGPVAAASAEATAPKPARRKGRCPYCSKRVALTATGKLWSHTVASGSGQRCVRSGGRPS
jgi:hypothetical protein